MRKCELCDSVAKMYCESDQASLCWDCDIKVHGANFLVAKHSRTLLCHVCQSLTPWNASGPKLGPTVSVCLNCVNTSNKDSRNEEEEGDDSGGGDDDEEEEENSIGEDDDHEEENSIGEDDDHDGGGGGDNDADDNGGGGDDDEENQVVPWSSSFSPPPGSSSLSDEEECCNESFSKSRSSYSYPCKRRRFNAHLNSQKQNDQNCCSGTNIKKKLEPRLCDSIREATGRDPYII